MPTFIKTGYWDKLSRAPKGYLNLDFLAAQSNVISLTKTELDIHVANNTLVPGAMYEIDGVDVPLYGGTTVFLQAATTNTLAISGHGVFYNPKYINSQLTPNNGYGVWSNYMSLTMSNIVGTFATNDTVTADNGAIATYLAEGFLSWISGDWSTATSIDNGSGATADVTDGVSPSYAIGQDVIWGGKHWTNTSGNVGTATDKYTLSSADWTAVPFNFTDYNVVADIIHYDYSHDIIIRRKDKWNNDVDGNYQVFNDGVFISNPIKAFQWGNGPEDWNTSDTDYIGVQSNYVKDSYLECINFIGQYLWFNSLTQQSRIYSNIINTGGSISKNILINFSIIASNIIPNGLIEFNILEQNSSLNGNTLIGQIYENHLIRSSIGYNITSNATVIGYNTLDGSSILGNKFTGDSGDVSYNKLNQESYIQYNQIDNSYGISYNTLTNSGNISNNTLTDSGNISDNTLTDNTSISNNTLTTNSYISDNTLTNSSEINFNILNYNSSIELSRITSESQITNNTFDDNSFIYDNTLNSYSNINNNTMPSSSGMQYNILNSYSEIRNNSLTNNCNIDYNTLTNSNIQYSTLTYYSEINKNTLTIVSNIDTNILTNSSINNNTLTDNSEIIGNTLTDSYIQSNTLTDSGYIEGNTLTNSDINSNTLTDNNYIINNALTANCSINNNVLNSFSEIDGIILANNSTVGGNALNGGQITNTALTNFSGIYNSILNTSTFNFATSGTLTSKVIVHIEANYANAIFNISAATIIYGDYSKQMFRRPDGTTRLGYYNNSDVFTVVNVNA